MSHCYRYAVAQLPTNVARNERLNLAVLIFEDGRLTVELPKSLDKVRAVSAAIDLQTIRDSVTYLSQLDELVREQGALTPVDRWAELQELSSLHLSDLCEFSAITADDFDRSVRKLLSTLVEPEPAPARQTPKRSTRLLADLKNAFRHERVMAQKGEDIDAHRIVSDYRIAEGLSADLLLKNGAMHIIQTADASSGEVSVRRMIANIAISTLVFEQAKMGFGEDNTKPRLVYRATSSIESSITPALEAAEHQGADLVNWESRDDRLKFIVDLSSLALPLEKKTSRKQAYIHASNKQKSLIN